MYTHVNPFFKIFNFFLKFSPRRVGLTETSIRVTVYMRYYDGEGDKNADGLAENRI